MAKMRFQTTIQRDAKTIYDLLTNLSGYQSWLSPSNLYSGMQEIADYPVKVGTTYVDRGMASQVRGKVIELEPYRRIAFVQTMQRKVSGLPGSLDIQIRYMLERSGEFSTRVTREVRVRTHGMLLLLQPVLLDAVRKENERIMQRMKWYLEAR